jgi:hypothetical protein
MEWIDVKFLSPEQVEGYHFLKNRIDKTSSSVDPKKISDFATMVEEFIKQANVTIESAKAFQECQTLKDKLASDSTSGLPPAISQKRDDAILRFSALKITSTLEEMKSVRAFLRTLKVLSSTSKHWQSFVGRPD